MGAALRVMTLESIFKASNLPDVVAAFHGLLSPYDGRKLYASLERLGGRYYDTFALSPCFQTNPIGHLLSKQAEPGNY